MATVRYIVRDVDPSIAFFQTLGFELIDRPGPPIAMMRRQDLVLWVSGPQSSAARTLPDGRAPEPGGWNRLVIEVEDLDAELARLRGAGVRFRSDPISGPGGRQILCDDPSGNPIELFEPRDRA